MANEQKQVGEVLTLEEAAKFLKISTRTLYDLAKESKVPHTRVGRQLRFSLKRLRAYMEGDNEE